MILGRTFPPPPWWLRVAREAIREDPRSLTELGREFAKVIGRADPFHQTVLSKFIHGTGKKNEADEDLVSIDLAVAISIEFSIPPPVFFPRTLAEAARMLKVFEQHDAPAEYDESEGGKVASLPRRHKRDTQQQRALRTQTTHSKTGAR